MTRHRQRSAAATLVLAVLVAGPVAACISGGSSDACSSPTAGGTLHGCDDQGRDPRNTP
jgi:hypothetical protein